jgi:hypothetical protein
MPCARRGRESGFSTLLEHVLQEVQQQNVNVASKGEE